MSGSAVDTRKEINHAAILLAQREGKKTRESTDSISLLTTTRPLADLLRAQHARCKGENAVNERNLATVALKSNFSALFKAAFKMHTTNAQESEAFRMFGLEAKIVKGENGMLTAILGTGDLQTKVALGANAETFFSRLVRRQLQHRHPRGNRRTALANNEEPVDTRAKLDALHAKLVRDNAGLPEDMKAMLEQVADVPFGKPYYDDSEFKVSAPIVANMEAIKNFVADLVFSDDTMVSDVVVNRPGESMRKFLSSDKNLIAFAEIIKSLEKEKSQEGTSPLLQKMMQGLPKEIMGDFADALADMKANLAPIPRKVVQAHFMDIINKSNGKIKAIELMKSLGAASVGEAFLCKFTHVVRKQKTEAYEDPQDRLIKLRPVLGNDGQPVMEDVEETVECVVKIMRHDAELRVQREAEIFTEEAKKIPGMDKTWQGQLNQYMKEFDFRTEAENINAGVQLYDVKGGTIAELEAVAPDLRSMKLSSLVPPSKNVLVAEVAIGQTVDSYFKERIGQIRNAASAVFERDPATKRIKWVDGPIDPETKKPRPVPVMRQNIPATAVVNMQHWICSNYADLKRASDKLLQATKAWFYEAILGSGKFHGDTHSGNLMVARNDITFIDFGNLYKLEANRPDGVNERHELMRVIMGAAFRNKDFVLAGFEKLLSAEGKAALNANRKKAEAEKLYNTLVGHADREHNQFHHFMLEELDAAIAKFREDLAHANTPEEKSAAVNAFTAVFSRSVANILQTMQNHATEVGTYNLESPNTFASAITGILFDEFDALSEGLSEAEQTTLGFNARAIARDELNLPLHKSFSRANIIQCLVEDSQRTEGDKNYKVDIGV